MLAVFHEGLDVHLVLEGADLQTVKEGSLRRIDLVTFLNNSYSVYDFNLSSDNLSGDIEGLEELGLLWIHSSGARGDDDLLGGN